MPYARQQISERELYLSGPRPLGPVAEQPSLEQRVFVGQFGQALLERCDFGGRRRVTRRQLHLQRRDRLGRHRVGRHRLGRRRLRLG